ncbi:MAG: hypothetical protein MUF40_03900 [Gemmatimonadaceae bacterium]|jgi:hypothetical protein|nr:hypothetical protein [Gemmatimonadaceae bacterium]
MSKKNRQRREVAPPTPFEQARDELFQQIMRCEVIGAAPEHQGEWFTETMAYFSDRYPELKPADIKDLRVLGERFVQPPKRAEAEAEVVAPTTGTIDATETVVVVDAIESVEPTFESAEALEGAETEAEAEETVGV